MARHFAFLYFLKDRPDRIREVAPYHADYWRGSSVERLRGGPFADGSGGLVSFEAGNGDEAMMLVSRDPFSVHGLLAECWLKEWIDRPRAELPEGTP